MPYFLSLMFPPFLSLDSAHFRLLPLHFPSPDQVVGLWSTKLQLGMILLHLC